MKKHFFISVFSLLVLSFVLIQCNRENTNEFINIKANTDNVEKLSTIELLNNNGIYIANAEEQIQLRDDYCYHYTGADSCEYVGLIKDTIDVPNLCSQTKIEYKLYWCQDIGQLDITDFRAVPLNPECRDIWNYWWELYQSDGWSELDLAMDSFEYAASKEAEWYIGSVFAQYFGYYCPNDLIKVNYHTQLCYKYCLELKVRPRKYPFKIKRVVCGAKCCKRISKICINPDGSTYSSGEEYEHVAGKCDNGSPTGFECDGFLFGECDRRCGPPKFK